MSHLTLETLARIADGPTDAAEAAHLATCAECRDELEALRAQAAALRALPPPPLPESVWRGVEAWIASPAAATASTDHRPGERASAWLLRAAAALAIFVTGAIAGAALDRESPDVASPEGEAAPAEIDARPATLPSPERTLREAEGLYAAALARYMAEHPEPGAAVDPMRRLAALESIILTAGAALEEAPDDAVVAGYYRTALAQREALLSQVQLADGEEAWF